MWERPEDVDEAFERVDLDVQQESATLALTRMGPTAAIIAALAYIATTAVGLLDSNAPFMPYGVTNIVGLAGAVAGFVMMRRGFLRAGARLMVAGIFADLSVDFVLSEAPIGLPTPFPPLLVISAGFMLGQRVAFLLTVLFLLCIPAAVLLVPHGRPVTGDDATMLTQLVISIVCAYATLYVGRRAFATLVARAEASAARADRLFDRAPDAMVLMRADGALLRANRAAVRLFAPVPLQPGMPFPSLLRRHDGGPADAAFVHQATQRLSRVYVDTSRHDVAMAAAVVDGEGERAVYELSLRPVPVARGSTPRGVPVAARSVAPADGRKGLRVLMVEDDAMVRAALTLQLGAGGWQVTAASGGAEALAILRTNPDGFDVVLTDVVMPGMNGAEFMRAARTIREDLPLVAMSGESRGYLQGLEIPGPPWGFIAKPFSLDAVRRVITSVVTAHSPSP